MAGYDGWSMSNNARAAYDCGEMPLSKWSKKNLLGAIKEFTKEEEITVDISKLEKVKLDILKSRFLTYEGWHHTSKVYNKVDFYGINEEAVKEITEEEILDMIEKSKIPRVKRSKKAIEEEKKEKRKKKHEKEVKEFHEELFKYQFKYKTFTNYMKYKDSDLIKEAMELRDEVIKNKAKELKCCWEGQERGGDTFIRGKIEALEKDIMYVKNYITKKYIERIRDMKDGCTKN